MTYDFVSCKSRGFDCILTIKHKPGWLLRLFGVKPKEKQYIGSCTCWHTYPDCCKVGHSGIGERLLFDIWMWAKVHNKITRQSD